LFNYCFDASVVLWQRHLVAQTDLPLITPTWPAILKQPKQNLHLVGRTSSDGFNLTFIAQAPFSVIDGSLFCSWIGSVTKGKFEEYEEKNTSIVAACWLPSGDRRRHVEIGC
jgi:hypothetical protein